VTAPRIGVSGVVRSWDGADRTGVNAAYVRALLAAGGIPLVLPPLMGTSMAARAVEGLDGLILTGGEDMDPSLYGAEPSPRLNPPSRERDLFELALFAAARLRELPILGICRGIQVINVAMGGTLYQDLPTERPALVEHQPEGGRDRRCHRLRIQPGSRTALALGTTSVAVNSSHHQAIKDLAPGLIATAWTDDDLIEAAETRHGLPWVLAVQWHPEEMCAQDNEPDRGLFTALVREAGTRGGGLVGKGRKEEPVAHTIQRAP
jgi:putative glutamine amidotransferase